MATVTRMTKAPKTAPKVVISKKGDTGVVAEEDVPSEACPCCGGCTASADSLFDKESLKLPLGGKAACVFMCSLYIKVVVNARTAHFSSYKVLISTSF